MEGYFPFSVTCFRYFFAHFREYSICVLFVVVFVILFMFSILSPRIVDRHIEHIGCERKDIAFWYYGITL